MEYAFCIIEFFLPAVLLGLLIERCPAARDLVDRLTARIGFGDDPEWMR